MFVGVPSTLLSRHTRYSDLLIGSYHPSTVLVVTGTRALHAPSRRMWPTPNKCSPAPTPPRPLRAYLSMGGRGHRAIDDLMFHPRGFSPPRRFAPRRLCRHVAACCRSWGPWHFSDSTPPWGAPRSSSRRHRPSPCHAADPLKTHTSTTVPPSQPAAREHRAFTRDLNLRGVYSPHLSYPTELRPEEQKPSDLPHDAETPWVVLPTPEHWVRRFRCRNTLTELVLTTELIRGSPRPWSLE